MSFSFVSKTVTRIWLTEPLDVSAPAAAQVEFLVKQKGLIAELNAAGVDSVAALEQFVAADYMLTVTGVGSDGAELSGEVTDGLLNVVTVTQPERSASMTPEVSAALLTSLVEHCDEAVIAENLDGIVFGWSSVAEKIFGYAAGEVVGKSVEVIIPDTLAGEEKRILDQIRKGESIIQHETIRRRKDGTQVDVSLTVSPIRDRSGEIIGASKIVRDISARVNVERRRRENEDLYRALFNSIDEGFCVIEIVHDDDGQACDYRFLEVNPVFQKLTGLPDVIGRTALELVPDLEKSWIEKYGKVAETGKSIRFTDYSAPMERWFDVCAVRVGDHSQHRVALVFNNITERLRTENQLRESEEKFAKAFNSIPLILTLTSLETGRFIEVNETFVEMTGFSRADAVGRTTQELGMWVNPADHAADAEAARSDGEIREREYRFRFRNGREIIGLLSSEIIEISGEACVLTVVQDVTERKRAAEISERYRILSSSARDIILFIDPLSGRILDANRIAVETYGYSGDELTSMRIHELRVEESPGLIDRMLGEADERGVRFETNHRTKDGVIFPVEVASVGADFDGGRILISIIRDIRERRQVEQLMRDSARQLKVVTDTAPIYLAHCDQSYRFKFVNESYAELYGKQPSDFIGRTVDEVLGKIEAEKLRPFIERVLSGERVEFDRELMHPQTGARFMHASYAPEIDENGAVVGWVAAVSDLTERRKMETALEKSEGKLRQLADSMPGVVWIAAPDGTVTYYNDRVSQFFGVVRRGDVWEWRPMVHPDDLGATERAWRQAVENTSDYVMEHRVQMTDGSYRWHLSRAVPALDESGQVLQWYGTATDIDDLKIAEEALRESEQRFRTMANSAPMLVWMSGPDKLCSYFNQTWLDFTGRTLEDEVGTGWMNGIHPDDIHRCNLAFDEAFDSRDEFEVEYRLRRYDGQYRWILDKGVPLFTHNGTFRGYIGSSIDVTVRREGQEALLRAERRASEEYLELLSRIVPLAQTLGTSRDLNSIYRALHDFIVASTPSSAFFVSFFDPVRSLRIAAYASSDGAEIDISTLPPVVLEKDGGPNSRAVFERRTIVINQYLEEMRHRPMLVVGDKKRVPSSTLVVPMAVMNRVIGTLEIQSYENNAFTGEHVIFLEMIANLAAVAIENVRLLEVEAKARETAEQANRAKDEFLSVLSHELRTPLNSMLGWTRMLRAGVLDESRTAKAIEVIERNTLQQNNLIEDLLDVSRIISGKMRIEMKTFDLAAVFSEAIEIHKPFAAAKNVGLTVEVTDLPMFMRGDATRVQQIVSNLVQNAIKFTPDGGRVTTALNHRGVAAEIVVSDTGIGIAPEFLPQIFERFRQADSSTKRAYNGLGLGLTIVRTLAELHGGSVSAGSVGIDSGATFTVTLPLSEPPAEARIALRRRSRTPGTELAGAFVLLVDDDPDSLIPLRLFLEREGAGVITAESAEEALGILAQEEIDVLVTDIGMPDHDGYDLIARVRSLTVGQNAFVPAIALTAYASSDDRRRALASGFQEHFSKPADFDEVVDAVIRVFRASRQSAD